MLSSVALENGNANFIFILFAQLETYEAFVVCKHLEKLDFSNDESREFIIIYD